MANNDKYNHRNIEKEARRKALEISQSRFGKEHFESIQLVRLDMITNTLPQANRVLGGKGLYVEADSRFVFVQRPPRGPRNKRLMRSQHFSLIHRRDGSFYATMTLQNDEQDFEHELFSELSLMIKEIQKHYM